jgi:hypothetical protein
MTFIVPNTVDGIDVGDYFYHHPAELKYLDALQDQLEAGLGWNSDRCLAALIDFLQALRRQNQASQAFRNN